MYLAGTTFGGAGGAATLTLGVDLPSCASCCCSGGGTGLGESPIWRVRCAKAAPGVTAAASRRSDRDLLTNFIVGFLSRGENFPYPLKTQLAQRALPNK